MKVKQLAAGVAIAALALSAAQAATKHHRHAGSDTASSGRFAAPAQPIAYSKLDAYLKASPRERAQGDWSSSSMASAQTGTPVNAAASPTPAAPPSSGTDTSMGAGATGSAPMNNGAAGASTGTTSGSGAGAPPPPAP